MGTVTARSSTIFIATGEETRIYTSTGEIPHDLRQKLHEFTRGMNSATIFIADKRGREELLRALEGHPSEVQCRLAEMARQPESGEQPKAQSGRFPLSLRKWLEILLPVALGASLWYFIESRF